MIRNCVKQMKRSVVLVIADPKDPNVKVLNECMNSLRDGTIFHLGNDFDSLKDAAKEAVRSSSFLSVDIETQHTKITGYRCPWNLRRRKGESD